MKKITIAFAGYGHFKITTTYRNNEVSAITTNTLAIDRYKDSESAVKAKLDGGFTKAQAAKALYNEIKRANNIP